VVGDPGLGLAPLRLIRYILLIEGGGARWLEVRVELVVARRVNCRPVRRVRGDVGEERIVASGAALDEARRLCSEDLGVGQPFGVQTVHAVANDEASAITREAGASVGVAYLFGVPLVPAGWSLDDVISV